MTMLTEHTKLREHVRVFVQENFMYLHPDTELQDHDQLLTLGILDSMGFVELVEQVQLATGIRVEDREITEQNFGSVDAIGAYVESKRAL